MEPRPRSSEIPFLRPFFGIPQPFSTLPWTSTMPPELLEAAVSSTSLEGSASASAPPSQEERTKSHFGASCSPRCVERLFSWCNDIARCTVRPESVSLSLMVDRAALKHVVGRGGKMMRKIEDYTGSFLAIVDCADGKSQVRVFGGEFQLAYFLVKAISDGYYSALDAISRNGVTSLTGW